MNLQSYDLTITGTATFTAGTINNGSLTVASLATTTFSGTTFGATVNVSSNSVLLNGSTFNSAATFIKKGSAADGCTGGNHFNAAVTLTDSGTGAITMGTVKADTFATVVSIITANSGSISPARTAGNVFSGAATFTMLSTGNINVCNVSGSNVVFHDSIILNASGTGTIGFGQNNGRCTLDSSQKVVIGTGFSKGHIGFYNLIQYGTTSPVNLTLTDEASIGQTISDFRVHSNLGNLTFIPLLNQPADAPSTPAAFTVPTPPLTRTPPAPAAPKTPW